MCIIFTLLPLEVLCFSEVNRFTKVKTKYNAKALRSFKRRTNLSKRTDVSIIGKIHSLLGQLFKTIKMKNDPKSIILENVGF